MFVFAVSCALLLFDYFKDFVECFGFGLSSLVLCLGRIRLVAGLRGLSARSRCLARMVALALVVRVLGFV